MAEVNEPRDQNAWLTVPGWLVVMILSPLVGMTGALWLDGRVARPPLALIVGLTIAAVGTSAGAMLAEGTYRVRLLRGVGGAALGVSGFALAWLVTLALTIVAKGM